MRYLIQAVLFDSDSTLCAALVIKRQHQFSIDLFTEFGFKPWVKCLVFEAANWALTNSGWNVCCLKV